MYLFVTQAKDLMSVLQEANQVVNPKLLELAQCGMGFKGKYGGYFLSPYSLKIKNIMFYTRISCDLELIEYFGVGRGRYGRDRDDDRSGRGRGGPRGGRGGSRFGGDRGGESRYFLKYFLFKYFTDHILSFILLDRRLAVAFRDVN